MNGPAWMIHGLRELGTAEVPGDGDNPRILEYHQATMLKATADSVPWCAAFTNWCLAQARITGTKSALARSFLAWGVSVHSRYGVVVVLKRGTQPLQGHVGFLVDEDGDACWLLGGNQSNRVNIQPYPRDHILGYRMPVGM